MSTFDQLLFDLTDIAIIVIVIAVWSLAVVGAYTLVRAVVRAVLNAGADYMHGRRNRRR